MTTPPITVTGLTPRAIDRDSKAPVTIDVAATTDYDLTAAAISFAFPAQYTRPTTWTAGEWQDQTAQHAIARSRAATLTAGPRDVYAKILANGHTFVVLAGRLHVT
jgi:hypothetical protein